MAMVIKNNNAAMMALGELNKNTSALGKQLKKVSSGQRLTGAGDGPSDFSISEKMRVRIRALDQDERNVQNGASLLRVAEGGIQSQIEIMKTIKQKVIDADNDTNTDIDRMTIQKEIDQGYRQIEDIAWETNYNGKRLLVGDTVHETVRSWVVNGTSSLLPGSDEMNIINAVPDVYPTLNGIEGPFDLFQQPKIESVSLSRLGFDSTISFEGGANYIFELADSFTTADSLNNTAFVVSSHWYILTTSPSDTNEYGQINREEVMPYNSTEIDIRGCNTVAEVMARIVEKVDEVEECTENTLISTEAISAWPLQPFTAVIEDANPTGTGSGYFSGGVNPGGSPDISPDAPGNDDGVAASYSLTGVTAGMGVTITYDGSPYVTYLRFVEGDEEPTMANGEIRVGAEYSNTFTTQAFEISMSSGNVTLARRAVGSDGNHWYVTDGISARTYNFLEAGPLNGKSDIPYAYATLNIKEAYNNDVETLISDLTGKAITIWGNSNRLANYRPEPLFEGGYPADSSSSTYTQGDQYYDYLEFIDSASGDPQNRMRKTERSILLDLNDLRTSMDGGKTLAEAFADLCTGTYGRVQVATDADGQTIGIKVRARKSGTVGNEEKLFLTKNKLRSYTLDYGKWFDENPDKSIPDFLDGKGFRVYCATCADQWFNFHFVTEELPEGRPLNVDPESEDIKHIYINVSDVTDAESLVQAIYDQSTPVLTGDDSDFNHYLRVLPDGDKLLLYDNRPYTESCLKDGYDRTYKKFFDYQWDETYNVGGAKIADGVWDNVEIGERDVYVKDLVIHHTDHASMNIHVKIPQTTMDHLFGYQAGAREWSEFNVMTAASREELLGNKAGTTRSGGYTAEDEKGLLDTALDYLTSANTMVGAQIMRLEMTEANIVTARESTTASESTIRDADMAKEMTEYTKANVLAQAAQSMLAQANQNSSQVIGLLQ